MRAKNFVQVSSVQKALQHGDVSPEIYARQVHRQKPTWDNQLMLMQQPRSLSPTSTGKDLTESAPIQGTQQATASDPPKVTSSRIKIALVVVGVLFAVAALTGMALGIYAAIAIQQDRASNATTATTTTTTSTTTTTTAVLPGQCSTYTVYNDPTRLATAAFGAVCDSSYFGSAMTYIRFVGLGGTQLVTSAPSGNRCGTTYNGWYTDTLPAPGSTIVGAVCYASTTTNCYYTNSISVTNCGSFYVYGLVVPPVCNARYCTV